jgi:twitching motility two-component system response regulator PilH
MATILIVDDSPTELHLFQDMLEKSGFDTLVADSGEDGIRQAETARPDCILMDVVMPGMNGFQATRKLTHDPRTSDIPVIMITTKDHQDGDGGLVACLANNLKNLLALFAAGRVAPPRVGPTTTRRRASPPAKRSAHICQNIHEADH